MDKGGHFLWGFQVPQYGVEREKEKEKKPSLREKDTKNNCWNFMFCY